MYRTTLLLLCLLPAVVGCARGLAVDSPVYWHEGEAYRDGPENEKVGIGHQIPASGGRSLYGFVLAEEGRFARYDLHLPHEIPHARLVLRYSRFHWRPMDPSLVNVVLTSGEREIRRSVTLGDTGDWGTNRKDGWGIVAVDVGTLPPGRWELKLSAGVQRNGDANVDGFFLLPGAVEVSEDELAAADRIDITSARYVGITVPSAAIVQQTSDGFDLVARAFAPHALDVEVTLLDAAGTRLAVLYQADAVPLVDEPMRLRVPGTLLRGLTDGSYTIRTRWQSAPVLELPVELIGDLASKFDQRLAAIAACHEKLKQAHAIVSPHVNFQRDALLVADFEHAVEYLSDNWKTITSGDANKGLIANVRRTLLQYEETVARIDKGLAPYAGRTGDLRLAFRSIATGKLEPYRLILPDSYRDDGRSPCILALNGTEDRFIDPRDGVEVPVKDIANRRGYVLLTPRASSGYRGDGQNDLVEVLKIVLESHPGIDRRRVYCTGPSAGGFGTYGLATAHPELFAAIACASGVGNWERQGSTRVLKEEFAPMPTLILHGEIDTLVSVDIARQVAERLKQAGIPHELHVFPSHGHSYAAYAEQYMTMTLDFFDRYARKD